MRSWTRSGTWLLAATLVATCILASASVTSAADKSREPTFMGKPVKDIDWYKAGKNVNRFLRTSIHGYDVYRTHNPRYYGPVYGRGGYGDGGYGGGGYGGGGYGGGGYGGGGYGRGGYGGGGYGGRGYDSRPGFYGPGYPGGHGPGYMGR